MNKKLLQLKLIQQSHHNARMRFAIRIAIKTGNMDVLRFVLQPEQPQCLICGTNIESAKQLICESPECRQESAAKRIKSAQSA